TDGFVEYKLFGAPQKRDLPDSAKPVDKEFSIYVNAQPEEAGLNSMLNIFFGGLTFGTAPSGAGGIGSVFDVLRTFQYDMGEYVFNLTDWVMPGYQASGSFGLGHISGTLCGPLDHPFALKQDSPVGHVGAFTFTPAGERSGTWTYAGQFPGEIKVTMTGSGDYTVEDRGEGQLEIVIPAGTRWTATWVGHTSSSRIDTERLTIALQPAADACGK
ncbi:MAG: hypothetical protein WAV47_21200, partial [Blastocatellia bacterium]